MSSEEFLITTYDPSIIEERNFSSEFETSSHIIQKNVQTSAYQKNVQTSDYTRNQYSSRKPSKAYDDYDAIPTKLKNEQTDHTNSRIIKLSMRKMRQPDLGKTSYTVRSRMVPCISSYLTKKFKSIGKNTNDDDNGDKQIKDLYRKPSFETRSVYPTGGYRTINTCDISTVTDPLKKHKRKASQMYSPSSTDSETEKEKLNKLIKKKLRSKLKSRLEYEENLKQSKNNNRSRYHTEFLTPKPNNHPETKYYYDKVTSSSSGFWDYIFEQFNTKYVNNRIEVQSRCTCTKLPPKASPCQSLAYSSSTSVVNSKNSKDKKPSHKKVQCRCPQKPSKSALNTQNNTAAFKPCQKQHQDIKYALAQKYKGEVLCIHNPPCILINGCLNLPQPRESGQAHTAYPVTEIKKNKLKKNKKKKKPSYKNESSQYYKSFLEMTAQALPPSEITCTNEKNIQSICAHYPPCELVRVCNRPHTDVNCQIPCIHVPLCPKLPVCTLDNNGVNSCQHKPKCTEIPVCSTKYIINNAMELVDKVRASEFGCHHNPSCMMVPRCVRRKLGELFAEGLTTCSHHPKCEIVPACSRKLPKTMVYKSTQFCDPCCIT